MNVKRAKKLQTRTSKFLDLVCTRDFFFFLLVQEWTSIQQVRYLTFWRLVIFYLLLLVTAASSNKRGKGETSLADAAISLLMHMDLLALSNLFQLYQTHTKVQKARIASDYMLKQI